MAKLDFQQATVNMQGCPFSMLLLRGRLAVRTCPGTPYFIGVLLVFFPCLHYLVTTSATTSESTFDPPQNVLLIFSIDKDQHSDANSIDCRSGVPADRGRFKVRSGSSLAADDLKAPQFGRVSSISLPSLECGPPAIGRHRFLTVIQK